MEKDDMILLFEENLEGSIGEVLQRYFFISTRKREGGICTKLLFCKCVSSMYKRGVGE